MEQNKPTTKGISKGTKSSTDAETQKPFSQSINYIFILCSLVGLNLRGNGKFKIIYNVWCGIQLLGTTAAIVHAILISDLPSNDILKLVSNLQLLVSATTMLLINFQFRVSVDSLAILIKRVDLVLMQFKDEQRRPLLDKLNKLKPILLLIPILSLAFVYYQLFERGQSSEHPLVHGVGNEQFNKLSAQYNLHFIPNVWFPAAIFGASLIGITLIPIFCVLHFIFVHFEKSNTSSVWSPSTDDPQGDHSVIDFIHLFRVHRDVCELLRLTDKVGGPVFTTAVALMTFQTISNARVFFVSAQTFLWSSLAGIIMYFGYVLLITMFNAKINKMFEMSLSHLMEIGLQLGVDGKLSPRQAFALSAKLDLYITHVQLDSPAISLGGYMKIKPRLLVQICGIVLSYTVFLYNK